MKNKFKWFISLILPWLGTFVLWAAEQGQDIGKHMQDTSLSYFIWTTVIIAAGFSFTTAICGLGQSLAIKSGLEGIARQPEASDRIQITMLLGLAFIESLALFALFINIVLLFANPFIKYLQ